MKPSEIVQQSAQIIDGRLLPDMPVDGSLRGRFRSRRERAKELQQRMMVFSPIYNAGWLLRNAYFGPDQRRTAQAIHFLGVLLQEMKTTKDHEALLYAASDALYSSPYGVPWEA